MGKRDDMEQTSKEINCVVRQHNDSEHFNCVTSLKNDQLQKKRIEWNCIGVQQLCRCRSA